MTDPTVGNLVDRLMDMEQPKDESRQEAFGRLGHGGCQRPTDGYGLGIAAGGGGMRRHRPTVPLGGGHGLISGG